MAGCVSFSHPTSLMVAPDHETIAYLWIDSLELPMVDSPRLAQTAKVVWSSIGALDRKKSTTARAVLLQQGGHDLATLIGMSFSPDSRHIAILSGARLSVLRLDDGRLRQISFADELVTSYAWHGDNEIVYAAYANVRGKHRDTADRIFRRQSINEFAKAGVPAFREDGVTARPGGSAGIETDEYFSPSGRYVVYMDHWPRGRFRCLDITTGQAVSFGQSDAHTEGVAWMPDDSLALCVSEDNRSKGHIQALLLEPRTGKVEDLSGPFAQDFPGFPPQVEPTTTPAGQFFIANSLDRGGCLVRPRPWEVLPVARKLQRECGLGGDRAPWIYPSPAARWFVTGGSPGDRWAFTHDLRNVVALGNSERDATNPKTSAGAWAFDGGRIVTVDYSNHISIRAVDLPGPALSRPGV
ncbi:MAG: hypothetical protein HY718_07320 [Planctomycetes bacterium]|nr:hypothetical protein [Planctomycetota bacterium]